MVKQKTASKASKNQRQLSFDSNYINITQNCVKINLGKGSNFVKRIKK